MRYAPIALFSYNRLPHLTKTLEALQANELASESELYLFSDGPKNKSEEEQVQQVRIFLKTVSGFKKVHLIESPTNRGLADSIISGVTRLTNEYGKVIILEDDIVTSKQFLHFMNDALDFYENAPQVMHISGYVFPIGNDSSKENGTEKEKETFFIAPTTCWGWATWKRSWQFFNPDSTALLSQFSETMIQDFNLNGGTDYFNQLTLNHLGKLKTWAVFWSASVFLKKGLSLHPTRSLTINIGHDGTGEHCSTTDQFNVVLSEKRITGFETQIEESSFFREKIEQFLKSLKPSLFTRIRNKIRKTFS